jgi:aerobic C4-dicarboxylate transport protein
VVDAFAKGDLLQVLLFSLLFGFALHGLGGAGTRVFEFIDNLSRVLFAIVGMIMKTAPLGAFGAMAFTIGSFGVDTLGATRHPDGHLLRDLCSIHRHRPR